MPHAQRGFTLIEMMVTVTIMAILAAIAYPSYVNSVTHTYRSTAKACMQEYAQYMERFYTSNFAYDQDKSGTAISFPTLACATDLSARYTFTLDAASLTTTTFKIVGTPQGAQLSNDTGCGTLTLDQSNTVTVTGTDSVSVCW